MAGKSWGHKAWPAIEKDRWRRSKTTYDTAIFKWVTVDIEPEPVQCTAPKCAGHLVAYVSWLYITGRRGRTSSATRGYCQEHLRKFCKKHGIELDATPADFHGSPGHRVGEV